uniref:Uncharacterized protein n=1 Tax=Schistocephalus solidus TaxID=70667 RepID=A0A0X3NY39_SCHSO
MNIHRVYTKLTFNLCICDSPIEPTPATAFMADGFPKNIRSCVLVFAFLPNCFNVNAIVTTNWDSKEDHLVVPYRLRCEFISVNTVISKCTMVKTLSYWRIW